MVWVLTRLVSCQTVAHEAELILVKHSPCQLITLSCLKMKVHSKSKE